MSVFWYAARKRWAVNYNDNGIMRRRLFKTEQEARNFHVDYVQVHDPSTRLTLGELVIRFFRVHRDYHYMTKKKIINFFSGYEKNGKHVEGAGEFLRNKYADTLNRRDLEQVRANIMRNKASNTTCNKYQAYIRAILQWAVQEEYILLNPWRDFKRLPVKQRIHTATIDHFKLIIAKAPDWLQWAFYTAYACSLRFGQVELFNLTWDAFHWGQGCVVVRQGKSGRLKRVYPPHEYMEAAHQRYCEDRANGISLVCHRRGCKVYSYMQAWKKALKAAGLEGLGIRPYDIRQVAATEMLSCGVDPATVASQLGHSTPATTMNFYAHTNVASQKRAGETLPSLSEHTVTFSEHKEKG